MFTSRQVKYAWIHSVCGAIINRLAWTAWSPARTLDFVCRAILALMAHPEADSPLNCD
uniref:UBC core domain-containing protein n=1 Tax=Triticum urartu TaxID=4572 RepID=A0A8R7RDA0_TRIUA